MVTTSVVPAAKFDSKIFGTRDAETVCTRIAGSLLEEAYYCDILNKF